MAFISMPSLCNMHYIQLYVILVTFTLESGMSDLHKPPRKVIDSEKAL